MAHHESVWLRSRPSPATLLLCGGVALAAIGWSRTPQSTPPPPPQTQVIPAIGGGATADSNQRMIAVTGTDVTGASVLYLVDTHKMRLAIYQANSTGSNQGVRFVGARRIELDMELDGYNDKSEYSFKDLEKKFSDQGLIDVPKDKPLGQ